MADVAAYGGYYIAVPADYIYATPHTLTGIIGVISEFVIADELLDEIGVSVLKSSNRAQ
jgi:protease-4